MIDLTKEQEEKLARENILYKLDELTLSQALLSVDTLMDLLPDLYGNLSEGEYRTLVMLAGWLYKGVYKFWIENKTELEEDENFQVDF